MSVVTATAVMTTVGPGASLSCEANICPQSPSQLTGR